MTACLKPFRPVGSVCGDQPGSLTHFNGVPFFVVPIGYTYAVYKGIELRAVRGGPTFDSKISNICASGKFRVVAEGPNIHCFSHHKPLWKNIHSPVLRSNVTRVLIRDNVVFSLGEDGVISTWSLKRGHRFHSFVIPQGVGAITSWCVPFGYSNKLLLGTASGDVLLYNYSRPQETKQQEAENENNDEDEHDDDDDENADANEKEHHRQQLQLKQKQTSADAPMDLKPLFRKSFIQQNQQNQNNKNPFNKNISFSNNNNNLMNNFSISAMETSGVKDIVALATSTGRVMLYDFASDDVIAEFKHSATLNPKISNSNNSFSSGGVGSFVTALCFRQETHDNHAMLITAAADGSVAAWDLEEQRLHGMLAATKQRNTDQALATPAHHAAVHTLSFFNAQTALRGASSGKSHADAPVVAMSNSAHPPTALLVTAGSDNAIVQWSFHTVDGTALRVRMRSGHRGNSCTAAAFYGPDLVVSAAGDSDDGALRVTHLFSDRASWELSQGAGLERQAASQRKTRSELLLAPCREILTAPVRNHQWSSVLTRHDSCAKLAGWVFDNRKLQFLAEPIRTVSQTVTCMAVSLCGAYVIAGFSSGHVVRISIQDEAILHFVYTPSSNSATSACGGGGGGGNQRNFDQNMMMPSLDSSSSSLVELLPPMRSNDPRAVPSAHAATSASGGVGSIIVAFDNEIVITTGPASFYTSSSSSKNNNNNNNRKLVTANVWMFWSLKEGTLLGWSRSVESSIHILREIGHLSEGAAKSSTSTLLCAASSDQRLRVYSIPHPDATWSSALPVEARLTSFAATNSSSAAVQKQKQLQQQQGQQILSQRIHVARCFSAHRAQISAVTVSPDTRKHVFSASVDGGVSVWDVAADACIGLFKAYSPITSLNFDPDGTFLLSTHAGDRCPQLWSCLLRYGMVCQPIDVSKSDCWEKHSLPLIGLLHSTDKKDEDGDDEENNNNNNNKLFSGENDIALQSRKFEAREKDALLSIPCQGWSLSTYLVHKKRKQEEGENNQLTAVSSASSTVVASPEDWLNMPRLDAIYQKNEPLLPPKKVATPFFLPMTQELKPTFIVQEQQAPSVQAQQDAARANAERRSKNLQGGGGGNEDEAQEEEEEEKFGNSKNSKSSNNINNINSNKNNKKNRSLRQILSEFSSYRGNRVGALVESLLAELVSSPRGVAGIDADVLLLVSPTADEDFGGKAENIRAVLGLLRFCAAGIKCGKAVDFVQALLATTLKHHGHLLVSEADETSSSSSSSSASGKQQGQQQQQQEEEGEMNQEEHLFAEVRYVLGLLKIVQHEARAKMDSMCGSTQCFASTFANAYG